MTAAEVLSTLTTAFRALPEEGRRSLAWHLEQGTPVLAGAYARYYQDGDGY